MRLALLKDKRAQIGVGGIITLVGITVGVLALAIVLTLGPGIGYSMSQTNTVPSPAAAKNTLTFTGNVSQNESVNITVNSSYYVNFSYNLSIGLGIPAGSNYVNLSSTNGSQAGANNLTVAINSNITLSSILTATNGTNATIVTYNTIGPAGNSIGTTDSVVNASWASATLTGGTNGSQWSLPYGQGLNGSQLWVNTTPMIGSGAMVVIAAMIIAVLLGAFLYQRR